MNSDKLEELMLNYWPFSPVELANIRKNMNDEIHLALDRLFQGAMNLLIERHKDKLSTTFLLKWDLARQTYHPSRIRIVYSECAGSTPIHLEHNHVMSILFFENVNAERVNGEESKIAEPLYIEALTKPLGQGIDPGMHWKNVCTTIKPEIVTPPILDLQKGLESIENSQAKRGTLLP